MSVAFLAIIQLAAAHNVRNIKDLLGCWETTAGPWQIAVNGHPAPCAMSGGGMVPPYHASILFHGHPAGIIGPRSGMIVASEGANENAFIAAVEAETKRLGGETVADVEARLDAAK